jgi:hypothetical protein
VQFYASSENVSLLPLVVRLNSVKTACWMNIIMLLGSTWRAVSIAAFGKSFDASMGAGRSPLRDVAIPIKKQKTRDKASSSVSGIFFYDI